MLVVVVAVRLVVAARVYENDRLVEPFEIKIYCTFTESRDVGVCVNYRSTYYKAVLAWGEGGSRRHVLRLGMRG